MNTLRRGKSVVTHQRCSDQKSFPVMRYYNVFTWTTAPFRSGRGRTCNMGWNSFTTTLHFARFGLEMHIGRGSSESKTECVFFPPPQFFQRLERSNDAASMIQRAFRQAQHTRNAYFALEHAHRAQKPPTSNILTLLPENFPIGSHVTVVSSHPKHANTIGVVT